jgi:ureidoglycolate lyase
MKLLRYGPRGHEKPGLCDGDGNIRDLSSVVNDIAGNNLSPTMIMRLQKIKTATLPLVQNNPRLGACVGHVGKFMCIGLNYLDHAKETKAEIPKEPIIFMKATSAINGPNDDVIIPRNSHKTDWEVELGVVIGKEGKYISEEDALNYVVGYCVINDVSERAFQLEGTGQWTKGKSCDTFGPIGPWLVTKDEINDPQDLKLWLEVDGKLYQNGNTKNMIFGVAKLVSYLSRFFTLCPGDIISTGTPSGVGLGQKPEPIYLKAGQLVRCGIQELGEQTAKFVADT